MFAQGVEAVGHTIGFDVDEGVLLDYAERILDQVAVVLAEVGPLLSGGAFAAKFGGQAGENGLDVARKDAELVANNCAVAWDEAGFDGKYGVKKTMGAREHAGQERDVFDARPRFALHAIDGSQRVGAGQAGCEAQAVEVERCDAADTFQIFDDAGEVDAVGVEQAGDDFVDLRALPRGPDGVGDEGECSAKEGVVAARPDHVFRRDAGDGDHQNDEGADRNAEDSVVCGTDPTKQENEGADEDNFEADARREKVKHRGGEEQAEHCASDAEESAREGDGELGLEDEDGGHREPVGARSFEAARERFGNGDCGCQAHAVAKDRGAKTEVCFEARQQARETHAPRKAFFALRTLLHALWSDVGGQFDDGADLAADGIHLAARIAYGGDEKRSVGALVGVAERFGFDVHRGEPCVVDFEWRIEAKRFADGGDHVGNGFEEMLDHLGGSESEFFAAHAAQQATECEDAEPRALCLIQERAETFADGAVIGNAASERLLRRGAGFDSRRRRAHELRGIGGGFAEREIEVGECAAFGIVGVDRPEQNREEAFAGCRQRRRVRRLAARVPVSGLVLRR